MRLIEIRVRLDPSLKRQQSSNGIWVNMDRG